uniref:DHHA1 domain-containing protein n=1 Tax=Ignisphaera aggregans TaxID=334771 RepID=A0A7C5UTL7_9CREN
MHGIVTHTDLDGIVGAAIYVLGKGIRKNEYYVLFIEPIEIEKICDLINKNYEAISIIDIGVNVDSLKELLRCIEGSSVDVYWYDHHIWDLEWINELSRYGVKLYIDSNSKCATDVVAKSINIENRLIREYVDVTCAVDSWCFYRWEAPYLYRYIDYVKRFYGLERAFIDILDAIERGIEVSELIKWIDPFIEKYIDEELKTISNICKDIKRIEVDDKDICIYYRGFSIPNQSIVGNAVLNICNCKIAAIIRHDLTGISFRSREYNVREIAKKLGGGGHIKAAGAPLKINRLFKIALDMLPDKLRKAMLYGYIEKLLRDSIAINKNGSLNVSLSKILRLKKLV